MGKYCEFSFSAKADGDRQSSVCLVAQLLLNSEFVNCSTFHVRDKSYSITTDHTDNMFGQPSGTTPKSNLFGGTTSPAAQDSDSNRRQSGLQKLLANKKANGGRMT